MVYNRLGWKAVELRVETKLDVHFFMSCAWKLLQGFFRCGLAIPIFATEYWLLIFTLIEQRMYSSSIVPILQRTANECKIGTLTITRNNSISSQPQMRQKYRAILPKKLNFSIFPNQLRNSYQLVFSLVSSQKIHGILTLNTKESLLAITHLSPIF